MIEKPWDSEVFDLMFRVLFGIRSDLLTVSLSKRDAKRFYRLIRHGEEFENLRGHLLDLGVTREDARCVGVGRHRLCWFVHTGRTLRELKRMRHDEGDCGIQELLLMSETDETAVRGYGMVEPETMKSVAGLFISLSRCPLDGSIPVREPEQLHASGRLMLDEPYILLLVSRDAYSDDAESEHVHSGPSRKRPDSHPPEPS